MPTGSASPPPAATATASLCAARSTRPQSIVVSTSLLSTAAVSSLARMRRVPARVLAGSCWRAKASAGSLARGRGERGPAGLCGVTIRDWKIDRARYAATPIMTDGREGPPLELRGLFEQFLHETR